MTEEQFNALTIMIHDIAYSVVKTSKAIGAGINSPEYYAAVNASERSGKAIEQAHSLFVDKPAKEICAHIVDDAKRPWVCIVCGETH